MWGVFFSLTGFGKVLCYKSAHLFNVYPEFSMPQDQISAFEQQKTASIASRVLATKLDWKIGQRITLTGAMTPATLELTLGGVNK